MRHTGRGSIITRVVLPLLLTAILQSLLIIGLLASSGVFDQLRENALSLLGERTQNKQQSLQSDMTLNWAYLTSSEEKINATVANMLGEEKRDYADMKTDAALNARITQAVAAEVINRLRANNTTGVFGVFDGIGVVGEPDTFAGLYVRDSDPGTDTADNSDLHVLRGLPPLSRTLGLSLDSFWQASFRFEGGAGNPDNDYFFKPLQESADGIWIERPSDGYWSLPFSINGKDDDAVVTYTEALINAEGKPYGVIGVELSESYLISVLNRGEFSRSSQGCYFLGVTEDGGRTYRKVTTGGVKYKQFFREEDATLTPSQIGANGRIAVQSTRNGETLRGSVLNLNIYQANTPFASQQWALIGLEDETTLFSFTTVVVRLSVVAAILSALLGVVVSAMAGRGVVRPIVRLVNRIQRSDPRAELRLEPTGIDELDRLAEAMTALNRDVIESATRLSKVLRLTGLSVGVFEIRDDSDAAYCSDDVFSLLKREDLRSAGRPITKAECLAMVERATAEREEESVYRIRDGARVRYVRIRRMQEPHSTVGTVLDVTAEVENRHRIERERDHDLLTGILNRRAFENDATELFSSEKGTLSVAAVIMLDLDNLKYLNDTFGHDCGDGYIRSFAELLGLFGQENAMIARRSGDEFYVLLFGAQSKAQLRERIRGAWEGIRQGVYRLPDGSAYRMRVSAGIAWYPDDSCDLHQLIHYADFTMYKVKRSAKGTLEEFNPWDYREDAVMLNGRDALDRLIDSQTVRFAMQPILSARTGEVYGYELLMRTGTRELPDPLTVLRLAREQGKLQPMERLTWFRGMETIRETLDNCAIPPDALFFLNSIADQSLSSEDERLLEERFGFLFARVVAEVTEGEKSDMSVMDRKLSFLRRHGGKVAIDDYGAGYNSEMALMMIATDIVKLDITFVHGVDKDRNKQTLIADLIRYARQRGIAVLAEGVETRDEMLALIRCGVDFLQGYYLGHPQYQPMDVDRNIRDEIRRAASEANGAASFDGNL